MGRKLTHSEVLKSFIAAHGDKYDYSKFEYNGTQEKSIIICKKHGEFLQMPLYHKQGQGCPQCGIERNAINQTFTRDEIIASFIEAHGDRYDYSMVEYVHKKDKVDIICKEHGLFSQAAVSHAKGIGCPVCGRMKASKSCASRIEDVIARARKIHGNKYDYSTVKYSSMLSRVNITCPTHGVFKQTMQSHLRGAGCLECTDALAPYKKERFYETCNEGVGLLYILNCYDRNENFYKVGITGKGIRYRWNGNRIPYSYKPIYVSYGHPLDIFYMEKNIHKYHKEDRYTPLKQFGGHTECFSDIDMDFVTHYDIVT